MDVAGDRVVASWSCAPGADHRVAELSAGMPPAAHALRSGEEPEATWPLDYLLQDVDDPSLFVPAAEVWGHAVGKLALGSRQLADAQESLVQDLAETARLFPPVAASLDEAAPTGHHLDAHRAGALLEAAGTLAAAGIGVWLPAELTADGQRQLHPPAACPKLHPGARQRARRGVGRRQPWIVQPGGRARRRGQRPRGVRPDRRAQAAAGALARPVGPGRSGRGGGRRRAHRR